MEFENSSKLISTFCCTCSSIAYTSFIDLYFNNRVSSFGIQLLFNEIDTFAKCNIFLYDSLNCFAL